MEYSEFLKSKLITSTPSGFDVDAIDLPSNLYPYQTDLVRWALKRGKAALFTMTGTGKTAMQVSWADQVAKRTHKVLILAPLAVSKQTVRESMKFGIVVNLCRSHDDVKKGINITNYEMLQHFHPTDFDGIVLDESSIQCDERHICPLQLQVIERGIELWSNPNDVVYDPFGGIGSTGYVALKKGRKALMSELKESYYKQNILNCEAALQATTKGLFDC